MGLSRRALLRGTAVVGATVGLPAAGLAGYVWTTTRRSNVGRVSFDRPLAIPPLAAGVRGADGRLRVDLRLQSGRTELLPGRQADTWGVNGSHLGPTVRVSRGDVLAPRVRNDLPEATTLHWHGMELPAECDGGPHQMIRPGALWQPAWRVDQPAATLWYHPHPHGRTKEHVYRGVAGLLYVDDGAADGLLPDDYGVDDIPVIVQDRNFTRQGRLDEDGIAFGGLSVTGLLGSEILVNGVWGPVLGVRTELVRLRVLNASNARIYDFVLDHGRGFHVVAGDNGLLPAPVPVDHLRLSPGERAELLVELRPDERVRLRSRPPDLDADLAVDRLAGGADEFDILELRAAPSLRPAPPLPVALPAPPRLAPPLAGRRERVLRFGDFLIDGRTMDLSRIDAVVPLGSTEIWRLRNDVGTPHNFHIHNAAFEVLDVAGRPPGAAWRGRKDTVYVPPDTEVRLLVQFGAYPSPTWPFMFHCHLLAHEDAGMMGQFVLVPPGTDPTVVAPPPVADHNAPHHD
ncbi:multicopper oxidase family protein [Micromonospora maritima]|uniref:multicopper oxidase family protein n=1 Tax=Micromonospora maritima TaxID=986711 RepID=UPI00157C539C|nr:multicopper oxidase domain-containing protein [Micromonospora maritima]